jgi:hypothetical protein
MRATNHGGLVHVVMRGLVRAIDDFFSVYCGRRTH